MSFTAKYPGDCIACDEGVSPGEEVDYTLDRDLVHVVCPEAQDAWGKPLPVCPQCFMVMPRTGVCECRS